MLLQTVRPSRCGREIWFDNGKIFLEQGIGPIGGRIPDLKLSGTGGDQQSPFLIPVGPLQVIERLEVSLEFQRIADAQAIHRLINAEFATSPTHTFHVKHTLASGLGFLHARVATLIPDVLGISWGTVRRFHARRRTQVRMIPFSATHLRAFIS